MVFEVTLMQRRKGHRLEYRRAQLPTAIQVEVGAGARRKRTGLSILQLLLLLLLHHVYSATAAAEMVAARRAELLLLKVTRGRAVRHNRVADRPNYRRVQAVTTAVKDAEEADVEHHAAVVEGTTGR